MLQAGPTFRVSVLVGEPRSGIPLAGHCQQVVRNINAHNSPVLANGLGHLVAEETRTAADTYDDLARPQCQALRGGLSLRHHVGARVDLSSARAALLLNCRTAMANCYVIEFTLSARGNEQGAIAL